MTVRIKLNKNIVLSNNIELENCSKSYDEGRIINLHPEFMLPKEFEDVDFISPNIIKLNMMPHKVKELNKLAEISVSEREKLEKKTRDIFYVNEEWKIINKIWSLENRNKIAQLREFIDKNKEKIFEYEKNITANEIIFSFLLRCLAPGLDGKLRDALALIGSEYKKKPELFRDFCNYHAQYIFRNNMEKFYDVVRDFFINYPEYSQNLLEIKRGVEIKEPYVYSSVNFDKTKKFYGDAYECLGSCVTTLACLSNIIKGRSFDIFEKIDLIKYSALDKSGKGKCFSDIPEFYWVMTHYSPKLRNGSHHGTFKFNGVNKTISYIPTKNQQFYYINYGDYLNKCTYMMLSCCAVCSIDIFIYGIYCEAIKKRIII